MLQNETFKNIVVKSAKEEGGRGSENSGKNLRRDAFVDDPLDMIALCLRIV